MTSQLDLQTAGAVDGDEVLPLLFFAILVAMIVTCLGLISRSEQSSSSAAT